MPHARTLPARRLAAALLVLALSAAAAPLAAQSWDGAAAFADSILSAWTQAERVPGAVALVARNGEVVYEAAFGFARLHELGEDGVVRRLAEPEPMTARHVFDLASVTKVMAATFAVMLLVDDGRVELDAPVRRYLPEFRGPGKDDVTVRHLLTHSAGLHPWKPLYIHAATRAATYDYIRSLPLPYPVGAERHYSDLGFMLLGYLVERLDGRPLDAFLRDALYGPLGLRATGFVPRGRMDEPFAATSHGNPYERRMVADDDFGYLCDEDPDDFDGWRRHTLIGEVNDGNAFHANEGVAGHAGLFSTARELAALLELLLDEGAWRGERVIGADVVAEFLRPQAFGNGLGWAMDAVDAPGADRPVRVFSHGGFTGTYVAGVPEPGLAVVVLTNRQNVGVGPDGRYPDVGPLRRAVLERFVRAAVNPAPGTGPPGPGG